MNIRRWIIIPALALWCISPFGQARVWGEGPNPSVRLFPGLVAGLGSCGGAGGLRLGATFDSNLSVVFDIAAGRASASASSQNDFVPGIPNNTRYDISAAVDIRTLTSVSVFFGRSQGQTLSLLDRWGIGAALMDGRIKEDISNGPVAGTYHGELNFSSVASLITLDILTLKPSEDLPLSLVLGARAYSVVVKPKTMILWNGTDALVVSDNGGNTVYPEVFLAVEF